MSIHRRAAKRDASEPAIIEALRDVGASVVQLSGKDMPDLLVGFQDTTILIEVKTGKGKLRQGQSTFADTWRGGTIGVARTPDEALILIGAIADD
jgi:hypothetical protein